MPIELSLLLGGLPLPATCLALLYGFHLMAATLVATQNDANRGEISCAPNRTTKQSGFTLIEVMVSLVLVSLTGLAGLALVDSLTNVQLHVDERYEDLENLQEFWRVFEQDIQQADPSTLILETGQMQVSTWICGQASTVKYEWSARAISRDNSACSRNNIALELREMPRITVRDHTAAMHTTWPQTLPDELPELDIVQIEIQLATRDDMPGDDIMRLFELLGDAS